MRATDIWNKLLIYWCKITLAGILFLLSFSSVRSQSYLWARENNPNYDERRISYGFSIGLHTSAYQIQYSDQFVTQSFDTVHSVMTPSSPGFSLGFLVNLRLYDVLDLRLMPKAGFYDHRVEYNFTNGTIKEQLIETTMFEAPLLLKYKSVRRGNVRMYMIGGICPSIEVSGKNDVQSTTANLSVKKGNFSIDTGLGFDFYFPLFKFSQEIRFSKGIVDTLGSAPSVFRDPIKRINTNTISVYFVFQ